MPPPDIRDIVDHLLAERKELAGKPFWHRGPRSGQMKWKAPMSLSGEVLSMDLIVIAYPEMPSLTFMLMVTCEDIAISRLDYSDGEEHNNGWIVPAHIKRWKIRGPHLHRWQDNREFATVHALPDKLEYAIVIPSAAKGFANAFRWFCGEHNIVVPNVPDYPGSELLL